MNIDMICQWLFFFLYHFISVQTVWGAWEFYCFIYLFSWNGFCRSGKLAASMESGKAVYSAQCFLALMKPTRMRKGFMGLSKRLPSRHFLFWKFIFTPVESSAHGRACPDSSWLAVASEMGGTSTLLFFHSPMQKMLGNVSNNIVQARGTW